MGRLNFEDERDDEVVAERKQKTRRPRRFKVLLHNDNFTTQDFVIEVLMVHFRKAPAEAIQIMLNVHHRGIGVAGVYTKEVAETKVVEVTQEARSRGMPLLLTTEAE